MKEKLRSGAEKVGWAARGTDGLHAMRLYVLSNRMFSDGQIPGPVHFGADVAEKLSCWLLTGCFKHCSRLEVSQFCLRGTDSKYFILHHMTRPPS